jgi:hypothetical protein
MTPPDPNATGPADPGDNPAAQVLDGDFLEPDDADAVDENDDASTRTVPPPTPWSAGGRRSGVALSALPQRSSAD